VESWRPTDVRLDGPGAKGEGDQAPAVPGPDEHLYSVATVLAVIAPHYPKAGAGRQPLGPENTGRLYLLEQWFNLPDTQAQQAVYESPSIRRPAERSGSR
jgi:hypothetical protein